MHAGACRREGLAVCRASERVERVSCTMTVQGSPWHYSLHCPVTKHTTSSLDYFEVEPVEPELPAPPVGAVPVVVDWPEVEPLPVEPGVEPWPGMPGGIAPLLPVELAPLPVVDELEEPMPEPEVVLGVVAEVEPEVVLGVVAEVEPEPMEEPEVRVPVPDVPHAASTRAHAKGMVHFNIRIS